MTDHAIGDRDWRSHTHDMRRLLRDAEIARKAGDSDEYRRLVECFLVSSTAALTSFKLHHERHLPRPTPIGLPS